MEVKAGDAEQSKRQERGPTCRRCGNNTWRVEERPKARLRWLVEMAVAAPDVLIFQGESGGWPSKQAEVWTCERCSRQVRQ